MVVVGGGGGAGGGGGRGGGGGYLKEDGGCNMINTESSSIYSFPDFKVHCYMEETGIYLKKPASFSRPRRYSCYCNEIRIRQVFISYESNPTHLSAKERLGAGLPTIHALGHSL